MSFFKKTYDKVDTAANVHDTVSHDSEAVTGPGQVFDYVSKFQIGRLFPFFTPKKITNPIEEQRKKIVATLDTALQPEEFKQQGHNVTRAQDLEAFQRQRMNDFEAMPDWQKREMGPEYLKTRMSMQDELMRRREETFAQKHQHHQMSMNFGRKPTPEDD